MKKLVLLLAVVFSVSLFSCGNANKDAKAADSTADTTAVVDSAATDSAKVDSTAATAAPADSAAAPAKDAKAAK
ncbi:MAG: entericidin [Muribaculaceae bacterium]|jgi:zona occludens toxin (predicted ATPase)|nr:entericidin [Muribaculaceae bacterium]